jgi:hypothetical protein
MTRALAVALALLSLSACDRAVRTKPVKPITEPDLVGVWNGHPTYSQKWIDETHELHPEGDYDLLVKNAKRREQTFLHTIELRQDGTIVGPPRLGGPMYQSVTWSLSGDHTEVLVTTTYPEESAPSGGRVFTVRAYHIADGGQTLIGIDQSGKLPETYGLMYHLAGSDADKRAFPKKPEPIQWVSPAGLTSDDYFGTWTGHHSMSQEHWEAIRGTQSLVETNKAKELFEEDATLVLMKDMTFDFKTPGASSIGKWHMEGAEALLEWDDRKKPGYQSTRPSPTSMPVPLKLQADGTLIVELRKYGSTGPIRMTKG